MSTPWTADDMPDCSGKLAIVTGGNSGLGYETSRELARHGAHVVLACRNLEKAREATDRIRAEHPKASLELQELDLASLGSVRGFAERFRAEHQHLQLLVNNAGVMALPKRKTGDGFEMQLGTNHLGHFALTGQLLDRVLATPGARVVTLSSNFHKLGRLRFDDLQSERRYAKWGAYGQSKLANLLFALELQRRLEARQADAISVAAHPGYAATNLQTAGARMTGSPVEEWIQTLGNRLLAQSAAMGALPTLYAATAPNVRGGEYFGPDGLAEMRGHPVKVSPNARARDPELARRLWSVSEELTGVHYEALAG